MLATIIYGPRDIFGPVRNYIDERRATKVLLRP